ncbi:hypothetical protein L21SP5_02347 [Salinivirga cyanobacteriivorans]|uniref:Uncharacterized protein n=1 Tax=Salinivirga cyanobacteriivorans TaxID=1307839 RepID=A0A0S2I161_9BACT|nr:hypothetical protein L21SP5_02347 [Salinivirga cyanobacteriivorans]
MQTNYALITDYTAPLNITNKIFVVFLNNSNLSLKLP